MRLHILIYLSIFLFFVSGQVNNNTRKCRDHEVLVNYTSWCRPTCPSIFFGGGPGPVCIIRFDPKCECERGWIYNNEQNGCIPEIYCPQRGDRHARFSHCGASCQLTCECMRPQLRFSACRCDRSCIPGYVCESGYVRNATGWCVRRWECPR